MIWILLEQLVLDRERSGLVRSELLLDCRFIKDIVPRPGWRPA
jgi:hypothetical protein